MHDAWRARGAPIVAACYVVAGVFWTVDAVAHGSVWRWLVAVTWDVLAVVWVVQVRVRRRGGT